MKNFNSRPHGGRREKSVNFPVWLISTHALTEGDEHGYQIADSNSIFQLTPSRRATTRRQLLRASRELFQLTPSRRATKAFTADVVDLAFQLTPSRRATAERTTLFDCVVYFNSRPHGGRRSCAVASRSWIYFNSRPHGGRHSCCRYSSFLSHFNSRPHGGRRKAVPSLSFNGNFNSRPHGGRRSSKLPHTGQKSFQLTPSRRATGRNAESGGSCNNFNSRPHGGRRFFKREINARFQFQLTPSRRATAPDLAI